MYGAVGAAGWLGLTYIFYHDFLTGFISMLPFLYFFFRWIRKSLHEKQIQRIRREFQELIQLLSGAFRTGHSAENAMQEASEQLSMMEGETAYMVQVMQTMLTKMSLGEPAEQVWLSIADACEIEEVKEFAKAFALAKRSGASMPFILQKIASLESADAVSDRDNACWEKARTKDYEFDASWNPFIFISYITAAA